MNPLSLDTTQRLITALSGGKTGPWAAGQEVATQINNSLFGMPAVIIATSTSTTTDFGALQTGDYVVHIGHVAGNAIFYTVATNGTLPAAAVVGDMYIVLRNGNSAIPVTTRL